MKCLTLHVLGTAVEYEAMGPKEKAHSYFSKVPHSIKVRLRFHGGSWQIKLGVSAKKSHLRRVVR